MAAGYAGRESAAGYGGRCINIFGYFFAKGIEATEHHRAKADPERRPSTMSYGSKQALAGVLEKTVLDSDKQRKAAEAMSLGRLFYNDFRSYVEREKPDDESRRHMLSRTLTLMQKLGELYAEKCLS